MKKITLLLITLSVLFASCAKNKTFYLENGKEITKEQYYMRDSTERIIAVPYEWANQNLKDDRVIYQVCICNVILDILFVETIIMPVYGTGCELYEPVGLKENTKH